MKKCTKIFRAAQATDYNMAHVHCMLDTTLRICNTHCFSTAAVVAQMQLNVTLYLKCSCAYSPHFEDGQGM